MRIHIEPDGHHMWNLNKYPGLRKHVAIPPRTRVNGPETIGCLTLRKYAGDKEFLNPTGVIDY